MSTVVQVTIGLLLLLAGLLSVVAAIVGDPIRLGGKHIPGPEGGPARAVVAVIGTAALAACAVVFILGGAPATPAAGSDVNRPEATTEPGAQANTGSNSGSVGGLPALTPTTTPTPTGSPKPPTAPSTAPPVPGKPTVTTIRVTAGATSGCAQTYRAAVTVANPPATITYVISVGDTVVGPNPRTATVTGTTANLDAYQVDLRNAGEITYSVLTPNRVSDAKSWTVPPACQPPSLSLGRPRTVSGPDATALCSSAPLAFQADLTVNAPSTGLSVTYHVEIDGTAGSPVTRDFDAGSNTISGSVDLPDDATDGYSVNVKIVVTSPVSGSAEDTLSGPCLAPVPPAA